MIYVLYIDTNHAFLSSQALTKRLDDWFNKVDQAINFQVVKAFTSTKRQCAIPDCIRAFTTTKKILIIAMNAGNTLEK